MLSAERQNLILEQLNVKGRINAADLAKELAVSEDTIRRDLNRLGEQKLLRRVHGGALPLQFSEPDYIDRMDEPDLRKQAFAEAALKLISPGQTLLIDSGETCLHLARALPHDIRLTVVSCAPQIAIELSRHTQIEVILIGGQFFKPGLRSVGTGTTDKLRSFRFDICFLGICAMHLKHGLSGKYLEEAETIRVIIEQSDRVVIMGKHTKLNQVANHIVAKPSELDTLITNKDKDSDLLNSFEKAGFEVITA